jgi:tubulin-specific chaperone E
VLSQDSLQTSLRDAFAKVRELSLDEMVIAWGEICILVNHFRALTTLSASSNELRSLRTQPAFAYPISTWNLKSLTLDYNAFPNILELAPLAEIRSLEKLHLKGNQIRTISDGERPKPIFGDQLHYIDLSYNDVASWDFVDELSDVFPGLTALRFSHNPVYESAVKGGNTTSSIEEGYMLTLARIANLKVLNFSNITPAERTNAEMFYLSRIGKAMAEVPESEEHIIIAQHRRFKELCDVYGAPSIVRAGRTINPEFLEARLVKVTFYVATERRESQESAMGTKIQEIPKGFDVYQVKGIVGRLFGLRPLSLRLIWETGEWDPVAGYEDEEEEGDTDGEDEEDVNGVKEGTTDVEIRKEKGQDSKEKGTSEKGKWMRREVELENGTRQIGFWIDGSEAKVRVEIL